MKRVQRIFETETLKGIRQAERLKAQLENAGYRVSTLPLGLFRTVITGVDPTKESTK